MKKPLLLSLAVLLAGSISAQLPNGSICPDFTGTDLDGNVHNLYDYLDQGYTVIVDVSATWCGPCWSYHNTEALGDLYEQYGPGTTEDRVRVLFVEGDQQTTESDLNGASGSQGDWVEGTPYPIIDDHTIANLLEISYYPTVYRICPNRIITEVGTLTTAQHWTGIQNNCAVAEMPNDPALLPANSIGSTCIGSEVPLQVTLQNIGTSPLTSATIQAMQGSNMIGSTTWTGNLATYGTQQVTVANFIPTATTTQITYNITTPDDQTNNNTLTATITASGENVSSAVRLKIMTDDYGEELYWRLVSPSGVVVGSGGNTSVGTTNVGVGTGAAPANANAYDSDQLYTVDMWLTEVGCYKFEFYDYYGDGICCQYGDGWYEIIDLNTDEVLIEGGEFQTSTAENANNMTVGVSEFHIGSDLSIFPNPSTGLVNLNFDLPTTSNIEIEVVDLLGKVVANQTNGLGAGAQTIKLDISHLNDGSYFLNLRVNGELTTRKVTLTR
ncbi:MAG: T9SS type A sorting domain-containing protein [Bacteroidota bacterium]|nr:T9SS type A sorting domain-containing protein [Bacteroidota bacterium]